MLLHPVVSKQLLSTFELKLTQKTYENTSGHQKALCKPVVTCSKHWNLNSGFFTKQFTSWPTLQPHDAHLAAQSIIGWVPRNGMSVLEPTVCCKQAAARISEYAIVILRRIWQCPACPKPALWTPHPTTTVEQRACTRRMTRMNSKDEQRKMTQREGISHDLLLLCHLCHHYIPKCVHICMRFCSNSLNQLMVSEYPSTPRHIASKAHQKSQLSTKHPRQQVPERLH